MSIVTCMIGSAAKEAQEEPSCRGEHGFNYGAKEGREQRNCKDLFIFLQKRSEGRKMNPRLHFERTLN